MPRFERAMRGRGYVNHKRVFMNTPVNVRFSRQQRGASIATVLVAVLIVLAIAAAAWFLIIRPHRTIVQASQPAAAAKTNVAKKAAPPPADVEAMSTSQLLSEASKAIREKRLLAPKGNNAFEFYLKVLDRQPDNQVAKEALRETFPFATSAAEQVINDGDYTEADREIKLLALADPNNYTLTILRSKLDARRKVRAQEQQQELLAQQQADQRRVQAAAQARKQAQLDKKEQADADALAKAKQEQAARQQQLAAQQDQPAKQPSNQPKVTIQPPVQVKKVTAIYPTQARRLQRDGWVEVEFTVGVDGTVSDAHVLESHPGHLFDHAALRAVTRWEFKPALRNGKPFPTTLRRRINFKWRGS